MKGNFHVPFLGGVAATSSPYPAPGWATTGSTRKEEMEFLMRELSQAIGLGGRVRKAGAPAERARINVTKAIKTGINKIGKSHPALGRHLAQTIRTGMYSSYSPDPRVPISWQT